ncbi:hypothetical protein WJX77_005702 [Trebouxia sp. C0004]
MVLLVTECTSTPNAVQAWHEKGQQGKRNRHAAAENHIRLRAISEDLDSHRPQTELGRAAGDDLIIAVLQHEFLLTRACMYVGQKEQDDRQRQMNMKSHTKACSI